MQTRAILALILIVPAMAHAGEVRVVDGDTLALGDQRIRLLDMDAPEARQSCRDAAGLTWRCGEAATAAIREMVAGQRVDCEADRNDRWGRALAICTAGGVDIGRELVRVGLAVRYRDEPCYLAEEAEARAARRGMWAGEFIEPYRWRRGERLPRAPEPSA